jgi:3',5'-cyclic AMP phosphodiesterase CpdA
VKVLHISDTHARTGAWRSIFSRLQVYFPDHLVILTGDVADNGLKEEFDSAAGFLDPFKGRVLVCPGNHDFGLQGNVYLKSCEDNYQAFVDALLPPEHNLGSALIDEVQFVRIISPFETLEPGEFACGKVGQDQMDWMHAVMDGSPAKRKVVYLHHHPFEHSSVMKLLDAEAFMQTCADCKTDVLLFGHEHVQGRWDNRDGIPLILACGRTTADGSAWEIDTETLAATQLNLLQ